MFNSFFMFLKSFASTISDEDMKDPDIKFFCENNPGWADVSMCIKRDKCIELVCSLLRVTA